ncbi:MAG: DUF6786 family protein [Flavobacterium sp.]
MNVFNEGITETAGSFGSFYEIETSSSAKELKVGESQTIGRLSIILKVKKMNYVKFLKNYWV